MKILSLFVIFYLATFCTPIKSNWDQTGRKFGDFLSGTFWKIAHAIKHPPYKMTNSDRAEVKKCVVTLNLRMWHHMKDNDDCEIPLTDFETYCKQMAAFKPGPKDPQSRKAMQESTDRYVHLTMEYSKLTSPYHEIIWPTWIDFQEIEDCYFNRDWQNKSEQKLNSHEALCRRISDFNFPNKTEALKNWNEGVFDITPYRKAWNKVPETGLEDYRMLVYCHPEDMAPLTDERYNECEGYYVRARKDHWRQKRLSKFHDCFFLAMHPIEREPRPECIGVEETYKKLYYSGKW